MAPARVAKIPRIHPKRIPAPLSWQPGGITASLERPLRKLRRNLLILPYAAFPAAQGGITFWRTQAGNGSAMRSENGLTYADAGVDINAANTLIERIKPLTRATRRPGAEAEIGGFGGVFDLKAAGFAAPLLVAATDGVG